MNYTKGPWHFMRWYGREGTEEEKIQAEIADYTIEELRSKNPVKSIVDSDDKSIVSCHDLATIEEGNAKLISAAPDLLEACKAIIDATKPSMIEKAYDMCESAIAKAEWRT